MYVYGLLTQISADEASTGSHKPCCRPQADRSRVTVSVDVGRASRLIVLCCRPPPLPMSIQYAVAPAAPYQLNVALYPVSVPPGVGVYNPGAFTTVTVVAALDRFGVVVACRPA